MCVIRVHPDCLRDAAQVLAHQSDSVSSLGEELVRAINRLDTWAWDGHSRAQVEPLLSQVGPESRYLAERLEDLSRKLRHTADEFESTDAIIADPLTTVFQQVSTASEWLGGQIERIGLYETIAAVPLIAAMIRPGTRYAGQVKFYGPQELKEWAGLSRNLTHIKSANLPSHMAKQALKVSAVDVLLKAGSELDENWKEYKGDLRKAAVGIAVDTAIGVGVGMLAEAGGTYIGAAIGQALIPIPGAGALIGGTVGRIAAKWAVQHWQIDEKIENIRLGDMELDQWVVKNVDATLGQFVDPVASRFRKSPSETYR